ncbi:MAG: hypothetical protein HY929_07480 [Euryarchaeota archaeon]|nr:hypothetical protein [Euryarchaeota archaeon]
MKVVQTKLEKEEYKALLAALRAKRLSLKDGLREAIRRYIIHEIEINAGDPFFTEPPSGKSGVTDISEKHDKYLYKKRK